MKWNWELILQNSLHSYPYVSHEAHKAIRVPCLPSALPRVYFISIGLMVMEARWTSALAGRRAPASFSSFYFSLVRVCVYSERRGDDGLKMK